MSIVINSKSGNIGKERDNSVKTSVAFLIKAQSFKN